MTSFEQSYQYLEKRVKSLERTRKLYTIVIACLGLAEIFMWLYLYAYFRSIGLW